MSAAGLAAGNDAFGDLTAGAAQGGELVGPDPLDPDQALALRVGLAFIPDWLILNFLGIGARLVA